MKGLLKHTGQELATAVALTVPLMGISRAQHQKVQNAKIRNPATSHMGQCACAKESTAGTTVWPHPP